MTASDDVRCDAALGDDFDRVTRYWAAWIRQTPCPGKLLAAGSYRSARPSGQPLRAVTRCRFDGGPRIIEICVASTLQQSFH
jgi:hypothetical protein